MTKFDFTPIVILGAGRSGTNALRDLLTQLPDFETWKCDEINPIWRHGNTNWPTDEIPEDRATPKIRLYIRNAFQRIWIQTGRPKFVVEKTCANTLRVPFVSAVLPEARFIHIVRDGVDVLASAQKRWQGEFELPKLPYLLAKARYAPLSDLPRYAYGFLRSRLGLLLGQNKKLSVWGPKFTGMTSLQDSNLETICAHQWAACVTAASTDLATLDSKNVLTIRYEDLVAEPANTLKHILDFCGSNATDREVEEVTASIKPNSVGKGRQKLEAMLDQSVVDIMRPVLVAHGYREGL